MEKNSHVTYGSALHCTADVREKEITGCRFSLYPMTDQFVESILGAAAKVHDDNVWAESDKLSTVYRGKAIHVEDAAKAFFIHAYRPDLHMVMEMTYSKGCPGDEANETRIPESDILLNEPEIQDVHFPVTCKIALYPMGVADYMKSIAEVVNHAVDLGIYEKTAHYCTILSCDVQQLFSYIHYVNDYCGSSLSHYIFELTVSVNSPTADEGRN